LQAQTLFVDAVNGKDDGRGTDREPVATLQRAVEIASPFTGDLPVTIKLLPGLYCQSTKLTLRTAKTSGASPDYTLEATIMPYEADWQPRKMPVIQSLSGNNSTAQFTHSVGPLVAQEQSSNVEYYYPITRANEGLNGLQVSQSYFIGERNSAPMQSATWAMAAE
jgi:hypothetical protein